MKTNSLRPSLRSASNLRVGAPLLKFSGKLLGGDNRKEPAPVQVHASDVSDDVAHVPPLQVGENLKGITDRSGHRDVDTSFLRHGRACVSVVATSPEENEKKRPQGNKNVDLRPHRGHDSAMQKLHTATPDPYKSKRHKLYMDGDVIEAFDFLCDMHGESRSERMTKLAKSYLRANQQKLRKAGRKLPESVFRK